MARMQAQIAIGRFFARFPGARLVDEEPKIDPSALPPGGTGVVWGATSKKSYFRLCSKQ